MLSEDGLLFLKNTTEAFFNTDIPTTYQRHANMPRIFKMAAVRVKHVFHKHYHHDPNSDTFITLTNLNYTSDPVKISREQIRGPLLEIVKAKRICSFAHISPKGVIAYTNSLVNILIKNGFMPESHEGITKFFGNIKEDAGLIESEQRHATDILAEAGSISSFIIWYAPIVSFFILLVQFFADDPPNSWYLQVSTVVIAALIASFAHNYAVSKRKSRIFVHSHYLMRKKKDKFPAIKFYTSGNKYSEAFISHLIKRFRERERWGSREKQLRIRKRRRVIAAIIISLVILSIYLGLFDYIIRALLDRLLNINPDGPVISLFH